MQEFSFCFVMPQVLRVVRQRLEAILGQTCSVSFARLLSPFGACEFRSVIRDENRDDAESALGAAAEPVILRNEDPDGGESA